MKTYHELTDAYLDDLNADSFYDLKEEYVHLRDHHIEETTKLTSKDRTILLQMAATIAGPASANTFSVPPGTTARMLREATAKTALDLAKEIIRQVEQDGLR